MMQKFKLSLLLLVFSSLTYAQGYISPRLQEQLNADSEAFYTVRIEFKSNVDFEELKNEFQEKGYTNHQKAVKVISALQEKAFTAQYGVKQLLQNQLNNKTKNVYPFWIINLMIVEAKAEAILQLAQQKEVLFVDLEDSQFLAHEPIIEGSKNKTAAPNGVEPGLVAINAPAMWALGYTGRGRLVYNYDTGVWPTHPSINNRFMANFYPLSQSWYGFFSQTPNGNVSDHGTHTLGTIAGLDEATNDTIGVAFGAYWLANDFVTSGVQGLPPLADMIGAFQWALNPDGDVSTTYDIPDVINNSWRWYDVGDTVHCGGFVVNLMNAIEAAGIANVFSGGNFGPSNTTISSPQRINTSKVNTFSVGSVDGNQTFPYPISSFSSKGPTQCPGSGSLIIHPEVVAPGQNVRSAWGTDGYNSISGTSMAAPHVSGAILLLKEAFPTLGGDELLRALYTTAIDMGSTGEDNTFGNGLIDVFAAYQHLVLTHTPVDPKQIKWDLEIVSLSSPAINGLSCTSSYSPVIVVANRGDSTITKIDFGYKVNSGGLPVGHTWNGSLAAGQSVSINLPSITFTGFGEQELTLVSSLDAQKTEYDLFNNRRIIRFNRVEKESLPFTEDFENGIGDEWVVNNEDGGIGWDTLSVTGRGLNNQKGVGINLYNYNPRASQKDGLISAELSLPATGEINLRFDVSYQSLNSFSQLQDTLRVYASTDCGATYAYLLYEKYGDDLSTTDTASKDFVPEYETHWRRDSINLTALAGQDILLQFVAVNRKGNNLYLDNISVFEGVVDPIGNPEQLPLNVSLYPNPANDVLEVEVAGVGDQKFEYNILNANGKIVQQGFIQNRVSTLHIDGLSKGLYFLQLIGSQKQWTDRFIKQ